MKPDDVLDFWFNEIDESKWWKKDSEFDALIKDKFLTLHEQANQCELFKWRSTAKGCLAEVIILDQFSRNIFRDSPQAFSSDALALALAQEAISRQKHLELNVKERSFLYMPFMHSESLLIHDLAVTLYQDNGIQSSLDFEIKHRTIIERFGRYPHRNSILNRKSTEAEIAFLKQPGSSF
ncbi:MAG: DUF924 family protein [Cellvibrionaceae bacterium]